MEPNFQQIKDITTGAVNIDFSNGQYRFYRFTGKESTTTDNVNLLYTAGIQMEFRTDGNILRLAVSVSNKSDIRSYFAFDIFADGKRLGSISNLSDDKRIGNYAEQEYPLGSFSGEFDLGKGDKCVRIVFPHSVIAEIDKLEIDGATYITPNKREKLMLAYGDSITQGYDALHPSSAYAVKISDALGAELINKALGGAVFSYELVEAGDVADADYVLAAYGTNDWNCYDGNTFRQNVKAFFKSLANKFPRSVIFALTPIWRENCHTPIKDIEFSYIEQIIREECEIYQNIKVISGINLVPHDRAFFGDLKLHPNDEGFSCYFDNLIYQIHKLQIRR